MSATSLLMKNDLNWNQAAENVDSLCNPTNIRIISYHPLYAVCTRYVFTMNARMYVHNVLCFTLQHLESVKGTYYCNPVLASAVKC